VSDVPFGAFLSGGIDSSTVVAYMSELGVRPLHTFSIGFAEDAFDETPYARAVAKQFGTVHHEEVVHADHLGVLPELVRHYGEPFADSSAVPTYHVSRLAASHVKMVLSGDGGDENFAGYASYPGVLDGWPEPRGFAGRLRHRLGSAARAVGLRPGLPPEASPSHRWYGTVAYFDDAERRHLWRHDQAPLIANTRRWLEDRYRDCRQDDLCSHLQCLDIDTYLANDILTKVDVASMCHGLEVRVPLLDHVFVEAVAAMPSNLKLRRADAPSGGDAAGTRWVGKYLLKQNAARFFPAEFLHRPKRGFGIPLAGWLKGAARAEARERMAAANRLWADCFDPAYVDALWEGLETNPANAPRIWSLLFLGEWLQQNTPTGASVVRS
jgi:asparagine synthase (glutamine-hydrolysing)